MKNGFVTLVLAFVVATSAIAQSTDPAGWSQLVQEIDQANPTSPTALMGKKFIVRVSGAKSEDTLEVQPADAFSVKRTTTEEFAVEIVDPEKLVIKTGLPRFGPIKWKITQTGINPFSVAIEGSASCVYRAIFSQKGGNELSLAGLDSEYNITHELSNPVAVATVQRDDRGLAITRAQNSPTQIRLHLVGKTNGDDLFSNWVDIPVCAPPSNIQTTTSTINTQTVDPNSCIVRKVIAVSHCTEACGQSTSVLTVRYDNICSSQVRCDNIYWRSSTNNVEYATSGSYWVQLLGGGYTTSDVTVPRPNSSSFAFQLKSQSCKFL